MPWRLSGWSAFAFLDLLEGRPLVDGQVVGLVALDDVLRLLLRGVPPVALEDDLPGHFLLDRPPDPARLRVPLDMIARLEVARHRSDLLTLLRYKKRASSPEETDK